MRVQTGERRGSQLGPGDARGAMDVEVAPVACQRLRTEGGQVEGLGVAVEGDQRLVVEGLVLRPDLVWCLGFGVWGLGSGMWELWFGVWGWEFDVCSLGFGL